MARREREEEALLAALGEPNTTRAADQPAAPPPRVPCFSQSAQTPVLPLPGALRLLLVAATWLPSLIDVAGSAGPQAALAAASAACCVVTALWAAATPLCVGLWRAALGAGLRLRLAAVHLLLDPTPRLAHALTGNHARCGGLAQSGSLAAALLSASGVFALLQVSARRGFAREPWARGGAVCMLDDGLLG